MRSCRPSLFWKRKFEPTVIVTCVRWYLRLCLSLRDVEELIAERGLCVDHTVVSQTAASGYGIGMAVGEMSGGDTERAFDKPHLTDDVRLRQPTDLALADDVHCLVSCDRV